ncbi:hypothetical protein WQ54_20070 [Bacillus sp. SA1-12]|uniref:hypothetical protein n=1 Tax=Bacillus sp. SA1-12 TaxID=1455638 RepID=UPI000626F5A3|nr:hypothetical protein [Bacillus sp. SA1-12]KKI90275.1 hypothetical protein WQ54_20070 [Bacillus sp. SA1-12]
MSYCTIDHSLEDVKKKLEEQSPFLLPELAEKCANYLIVPRSQNELNELFHFLKKYDLATMEEREIRNKKIAAFIEN